MASSQGAVTPPGLPLFRVVGVASLRAASTTKTFSVPNLGDPDRDPRRGSEPVFAVLWYWCESRATASGSSEDHKRSHRFIHIVSKSPTRSMTQQDFIRASEGLVLVPNQTLTGLYAGFKCGPGCCLLSEQSMWSESNQDPVRSSGSAPRLHAPRDCDAPAEENVAAWTRD